MRIGIARIAQETNTFSPVLTDVNTLLAFGVGRGDQVFHIPDWSDYIDGFLDVVGNQEIVGITSVHALPAGYLTEEALRSTMQWFTEDLRKAMPLDGVLLSMHGAFAGVTEPDVEGLVLQTAREILGDQVFLAASLDLHANITRRMIDHADFLYGLHTHPHTDSRETGATVARMLMASLHGEVQPATCAIKIPMITPAETQLTEEYPLKALIEATRRQEDDQQVLGSSLFAVQPWLDVPEMGWSAVVVTDGDAALAEQLARELAGMAWDKRREYNRPCPSYTEALDLAFASDARPVVISDFADLMTGGGTGDSTWYLKELLRRNPSEPCYITMVDAEAVAQMAAAGAGASVTLALGGKLDNIHSMPVQVQGEVLRVIPVSPDRQLPASMGMTAVLKAGNIYIVVFERLTFASDPGVYIGAGLDPYAAKIMIAKSVVDWREGYKGYANLFLLGEAPGLAPSNLRTLEWKNVLRPIYPLDEEMSWDSRAAPAHVHSRRIQV